MYIINVFVTLFVCVSFVSGAVNSTDIGTRSRMAWMKSLLDHHDWINVLNGNHSVAEKCEFDLRQYVTALNEGLLWASKTYEGELSLQANIAIRGPHCNLASTIIPRKTVNTITSIASLFKVFDASGQYSPNILFGNDYWMGSINACRDLQLKEYYAQTPPFPTTFFVAKVNLTVDGDHIPETRPMLVGQCVPASCSKDDVKSVLDAEETKIKKKAIANGITASFTTLYVRPVPGTYDVFSEFKLHILLTVISTVSIWMLAASIYEGYLERKYRNKEQKDLEVANNNHKPTLNNNNTQQESAKVNTDDNKEKDVRREPCGMWSEILLSFSILSNGRAILGTQKPNDGALTCLHGMRFMSVLWVIMVHTYLTIFYIADNKTMRIVTERNFLYQSVGNASYCVDSFFFISGLLVTVLFLRTEDKKKSRKNINKAEHTDKDINKTANGYTNSALSVSVISQEFYEDLLDKPAPKVYSIKEIFGMTKSFFVLFLYRVVRLTPAYAFVIGLNELALRYTYDHTVFEPAIFDHINCNLYWWRNLLYINNLFPQKDMCMVWSWYMANDTQFYAVGIILLLISVKHVRFAMGSLMLVLVSSWATTIYVSVSHQYKARIQEPFEMFDPLYDKPWSRIGPYLVGMAVGWYLHKTKCQVRMPYWLVAIGWPTSLLIIASLIFGMVDGYFEVWPTAFYVSVGHTAWGVALAWVSIACCCGYGGLVNSALSYRGLLPLSRLTYCAYLVHPTIMMYTSFLLDGPLHLQNSIVIIIYSGYAVMAFLASFAISLAFEAPAVRLLKIISGGSKSKNQTG